MTIAEMRAAIGAADDVSDLDVVALYAEQFGNPAAFVAPVVAPPTPVLTPEQAALASIRAAFADPEPIIYTQGGVVMPPISAIRSDEPGPAFDGPGRTSRTISYEIYQGDLPARPKNGETFTHRARVWLVGDVTTLSDVEAWRVIVSDAGAAA